VDRLFPGWLTPNHLTFARMALSLAIVGLELAQAGLGWMILLGLAAGFSDLFDGALARQRGETSALGAFLDPAGDKLFALVLAFLVWRHGWVSLQLLLAFLLTELHVLLIPALSLIRRKMKGQALWPPPKVEPNRLGKLKTGWLASAMGLMVIGGWLAMPGVIVFAWWNLWVALGLGLAAELRYLADFGRGAFA